ncbi:hypothetical protein ABIB40_002355 [Pedobacter sp. UYP30]|uniref:DUF6600 domain-containing protein n=1 Tax=Pedobacter sp. UYP30 TaxID=1756400 RepID=UPI003394E936
MKKLKTTALALGLFTLLAGTTIVRAQDYDDGYQDTHSNSNDGNVSLQTFYDELSPYGTWIQDPQYGYVWRPDVDQSEFRPYYTQGRWAMTEYGNTWVSNYDWGWAPFHYGRWVYNNYRQWIWLPGTTWGPAWVDWRSGGGYYGWAPMGPSININISFGRRYALPNYCWNFIPRRSIYNNYYPRYNYGRNNVYIRNTTIINNTYVYNRRTYYGGPSKSDIRRATNRDVTVYGINRTSRPGASEVDNRAVNIYRPRPERGESNRTSAPKDFQRGSIASVRDVTSGRPERTGANVNNNTDRTSATQENRRVTDQNVNRDASTNGRPQRGVATSNGTTNTTGGRNVMDRNPREQTGISSPAEQNNARPSRNNIEATNQPANANAARQQQNQQRAQRLPQTAPPQQRAETGTREAEQVQQKQAATEQRQAQQQREQRGQEQAAQAQREQQAQQQKAQSAQREQAVQKQAEQQRTQRAQQEQSQRQEQARQQQQRQEKPQRVERAQPPRQQPAPARTENSRSGGRPSRG